MAILRTALNRQPRLSIRTLAAVASGSALVLAACGGNGGNGDNGTDEAADQDGTSDGPAGELRIAIPVIPENLDPLEFVSAPQSFTRFLFHETVTKVLPEDGEFVPLPGLATDWEPVDDTTWRFELAAGLTFPNGQSLDAHAVQETFEFVLDPDNDRALLGRVDTITSVQAESATELVVETEHPDPLLPAKMSAIGIIASDQLEVMAEDGLLDQDTVVSAGPFRVESYVPQERLVVEANPDAVGETPAVERIEFLAIPEDGARVAALEAGEVDVAGFVPPDLASGLGDAGFEVVHQVDGGSLTPAIVDVQAEPYDDVRVRQAVNYAVDKEALVQNVLKGFGAVADGQLVGPGMGGYCERVQAYEYDPDRAMELLAEAGYEDGFETSISVSSGSVVADAALGEAIGAMLEDVGLSVTLDVRELSRFLDAFYNRDERQDLLNMRINVIPAFDADAPMSFFDSEHPVDMSNYASDEYDEVFRQAQRELDPEQRTELMCQAAETLHEDAPLIFGVHLPDIYVVGDDVSSFEVRQNLVPDFVTMH